jgi:biotin transporter BioY
MYKLKGFIIGYLPLVIIVSSILYVSNKPKVEQMKKIIIIVVGSSVALLILVKQFIPISSQ